jgi:hypothetical protein
LWGNHESEASTINKGLHHISFLVRLHRLPPVDSGHKSLLLTALFRSPVRDGCRGERIGLDQDLTLGVGYLLDDRFGAPPLGLKYTWVGALQRTTDLACVAGAARKRARISAAERKRDFFMEVSLFEIRAIVVRE